MREIKFRLLKEEKIVGYEKHVLAAGKIHIFHSVLNDDNTDYEWKLIWHDSKTSCIEHDDKEQFTSLHDKNGKEIYEGDIAKVNGEWGGDNWHKECLAEIKYENEEACFYPHNHKDKHGIVMQDWEWNQLEIVGNIHKNPEYINE